MEGDGDDERQEADNILDYAIEYCMTGSYPQGLTKDKKRAVRKRAKAVTIENGEVYLQRKKSKVKVITSDEDQKRILHSCHSDPTSGHFGVTKTWRRLAERFYWKGMYQDAKSLVTQCHECQLMNKKLDIVRPELYPVPVKSPWHHIGMDFVGPIHPPSSSGNRYILTISDYFTKFAWAKALPTKEAANVVGALRELFFVLGLPSVLTTDQGKEFNNQVNSELMRMFGIEHRLTTAYHPQANGLDERFNQTLANSLAKFSQVNRHSWDEHLGAVVYAYNSAVQESTKHSPFEAMFGRRARLPIDINAETNYDPDEKLEEYASKDQPNEEQNVSKRRKMETLVKTNIEAAQAKQKKYYDEKFGASSCFSVGCTVLKKDFRRKKRRGGKLDYRWQGPYTITTALGKGLFQLKELNGDKVVERVNGFHLKRYTCPETPSDKVEESSKTKDPVSSGIEESTHVTSLNGSAKSEDSIPPLPPPMPPLCELSRKRKYNQISDADIVTSTPSSRRADFFSCSLDEPPSPIRTKPSGTEAKCKSLKPRKPFNIGAKNLMLKKRQRKPTNHVNREDPICVETHKCNKTDKSSKQWIPALGLSNSDRDCLLTPAGWLTDSIIDAAQKLLGEISPVPGLESVACGLTMTYAVQPGEFIQILHTGRGHWVTVSTIGVAHPLVCVYDSLYSSAGTRLEAQIASLIHTENSEIYLKFMDVPVQAGTSDCGLFAVAFATALAFGMRPEDFQFDQHKMRRHLWQCLEKGKMEMFPVIRKRRSRKTVRSTQEVLVYCDCRMPEMGERMVECSRCTQWFHVACVEVHPAVLDSSASWFCKTCS